MKLLVDIIFSDVINFSNGGFKLYQGSLLCFSERPCYIDIRLDTSIIYESRKIELIRCFSRGGTIAGFFNYEVFPCSFADASLEPKNRCFDLGGISLKKYADISQEQDHDNLMKE